MASAIRSLPSTLYSPTSIPIFLAPLLGSFSPTSLLARNRNVRRSKTQKRDYSLESAKPLSRVLPFSPGLLALPRSCPGCGAFTQTLNPEGAGFYSSTRRSVKAFVAQHSKEQLGEAETFQNVLGHANQEILQKLGLHEPLEVSGGKYLRFALHIRSRTDQRRSAQNHRRRTCTCLQPLP